MTIVKERVGLSGLVITGLYTRHTFRLQHARAKDGISNMIAKKKLQAILSLLFLRMNVHFT